MGIDISPFGKNIASLIFAKWENNYKIILSNPEFVMKKIRFLLPIVAMVIAIFISCKTEGQDHYDPLNGHDNIIKTKIKSGTKVLAIGDSVTDELEPNKEGLGSWAYRFAEYANLSVKNIAVCSSTYSLYRMNVDGLSSKYGRLETINLGDYDYIIITGGVNNIYLNIDDVEKSFRDLDYTCHALSPYKNKVTLCNPFYFSGRYCAMTTKEAYDFRNKIYKNAIKFGFSYIDLTKFNYERADPIHPTPLGCIQIATQMFRLLGEK